MDESDHERDLQSLRDKLSDEVSIVSWHALEPHAQRHALFWVNTQLDLVEVAVSIALDDVDSVEAWHTAKLLLRATPTPPKDYAAFHVLIVQPFVLAQPLELPLQSEKIH